jgi:hypothetical protein
VSSLPATGEATYIWATRGRAWGFRFLRKGGLPNPLAVYEAAFSKVGDEPELWRRVGDKMVLRFPDPEGRRDAAGRVIPHNFVLLGGCVDGINSFEDAFQRIWHEVSQEFDRVWDKNEPPSAQE